MSDSDSESSEEGQELDEVYGGDEERGTQLLAAQHPDPGHGQVVASHTALQETTASTGGIPHHLPLQLPQPPQHQDVKFEV